MGCRRGNSSGSQQAGGSTDIEGPINRDDTAIRPMPEPEDAEDPEELIAAEAGSAGQNEAAGAGAEARLTEQTPTPLRNLVTQSLPYVVALTLAVIGAAVVFVLRRPRERSATRYVYAAPVTLSDSSGHTTPSVFSNISTEGARIATTLQAKPGGRIALVFSVHSLDATIKWAGDGMIGVAFDRNLESYELDQLIGLADATISSDADTEMPPA